MISGREDIYQALFATLQSALLSPAGPFKTVSRRWQEPGQMASADRPALFQVQTRETATTRVSGSPVIWKAGVNLVVYTSGSSDPSTVPSTELNALLDSVEAALSAATAGVALSLGARVSHCRIEGRIEIVENVHGTIAMAMAPVEIVVTA